MPVDAVDRMTCGEASTSTRRRCHEREEEEPTRPNKRRKTTSPSPEPESAPSPRTAAGAHKEASEQELSDLMTSEGTLIDPPAFQEIEEDSLIDAALPGGAHSGLAHSRDVEVLVSHPKLDKNLLAFNSLYKILVCTRCSSAVEGVAAAMQIHARSHEVFMKAEEGKFIEETFQPVKTAKDLRLNTDEAGITLVVLGVTVLPMFRCKACEREPTPNVTTIQPHVSKEHRAGTAKGSGQELIERCSGQAILNSFFRVLPGIDLESCKGLHLAFSKQRPPPIELGLSVVDNTQIAPFWVKTSWAAYLKRIQEDHMPLSHYRHLCHLPHKPKKGAGNEELTQRNHLHVGVKQYVIRALKGLSEEQNLVLRIINSSTRWGSRRVCLERRSNVSDSEISNSPLALHQKPATIAEYADLWYCLLAFVITCMDPHQYLDRAPFQLRLPEQMRVQADKLAKETRKEVPDPLAMAAAVHGLSWQLAILITNDREAKHFSHPGIQFLIGHCVSTYGSLAQVQFIPPRCSKLQYILRLIYLEQWRKEVEADPECIFVE